LAIAQSRRLALLALGLARARPTSLLVYKDIYAEFFARVKAIKLGNPLDTDTVVVFEASNDQFEKT
jgi:hypothetical protein